MDSNLKFSKLSNVRITAPPQLQQTPPLYPLLKSDYISFIHWHLNYMISIIPLEKSNFLNSFLSLFNLSSCLDHKCYIFPQIRSITDRITSNAAIRVSCAVTLSNSTIRYHCL